MKAIKRLTAKSATPISSHPLFPAIVALWFAALFGFGSLVLPTILIERAISAIGLPSLIGATAPPLGFTAKLLIAACAAMVGAVLGFVIARKVSAAQKPEKARQRGFGNASKDETQKRPIFANEELGSDTFDAPVDGPIGGPAAATQPAADNASRRRGLSISEDESGPSEYLQQVPMPGAASLAAQNADFGDEDVISFTQPEATTDGSTTPMHYSSELEKEPGFDAADSNELHFQPAAEAAPAEQRFESKQVFQPQAAEPIHNPANAQGYKAEVQEGMPRLKVEPDSEMSDEDDFGFQPLETEQKAVETPINPALEARLSGLTQEQEGETSPTSVLQGSLRPAQSAPENAASNPVPAAAAPLAFSPPSLGKQKPEVEPFELSETVPEEEPLDLSDTAQTEQFDAETFEAPQARPFDLPKGFENAAPLETAQPPVQQFDPLGHIDDEEFDEINDATDLQFAPLAHLQSELASAAENADDGAETEEPLTLETEAFAEEQESPDVVDEHEEELPLMTDPISGQPLDALGTVELIERLAKSVRLRANSGASQSAIAASAVPDSQQKQIEQELAEQAEEAIAEPIPEAEADVAAEQIVETDMVEQTTIQAFAPPAQDFSAPQEVATAQPADDFVPSSLKPIDLHLDEEFQTDEESFSLPLGKPAPQPNANAPFSAPAPAQILDEAAVQASEPSEVPPAPQSSPFAAPTLQAFEEPAPAPDAFASPAKATEDAQEVEAELEEEEPFGSLLELRNRLTQQQFVRVDDEPEDDDAGEPAVIFPGQGEQAEPYPAAAEASSATAPIEVDTAQQAEAPQETPSSIDEQEQQPTAPFTSPGFGKRPIAGDASQMPSAMPEQQAKPAAPVKDPAETERALRSALATLQRMSGAA